jgi:hypothetical protein
MDHEGDLLGTEEFSRNVANVREELGQSRENALLRGKMESASDEELQSAMDGLLTCIVTYEALRQAIRNWISDNGLAVDTYGPIQDWARNC